MLSCHVRSITAARRATGWLGFAALGLLACQKSDPGNVRSTCTSCSWQLLGVHPQAQAQPTATGRALVTLCPWQGRLYIGYGDYQQNTGPIDVTAWDPTRSAFTTIHTSDTEAIYNYRAIGASLYAPATDRRQSADYAVGEPWRDENPVTVAHAYDMATLDGTDLWLVGSSEDGYRPTAWRSTDHGAHWAIAHQLGSNGRYYFAAVYHHKLYLESWSRVPMGPSEVFDGTSWSPGPELLPAGGHGFRPIVFAGLLLYATKQTLNSVYFELNSTPNKLLGFDGTLTSIVFARELLDFFADERELLVLDAEGTIWRTTDLANWSHVAVATALHPRSVALLDDVLYLGTTDARLYRLVGWPRG
jgi:hypothetical protein